MDITIKLQKIKAVIERAKTDLARFEGELSAQRKTLKKDFGCSSVTEAEKKIRSMRSMLKDKKEKLEKGLQELQEFF